MAVPTEIKPALKRQISINFQLITGVDMKSPLLVLLITAVLLAGTGRCDESAQTMPGLSPKSSTMLKTDEDTGIAGSSKDNGFNEDPEPTPSATEGPYFKPGSPERKSLLDPGIEGDKLNLTGLVLARTGRPIANALIDFWQADANGVYDNSGYRLRGHQYTDSLGRYQLETVIPGIYIGRTRHIHVKVQAPDGTELTTQLFFPGDANNQGDSIFDPRLLISFNGASKDHATFSFVLDTE
jgi:protocatechuate 3,4-dioxygenase beta subunit